jgi:mannose-6-phosphate isomerase-like protein (cupin superfamily)
MPRQRGLSTAFCIAKRLPLDGARDDPYPAGVPFVDPPEMLQGEPLPGWVGHFFHAENMTFAHYDIASDAAPLHEHHHEQEEVWNVVDGEIAITIAGEERRVGRGGVAIVPPNTPHSVRPLGACRAVIADYPLRLHLPGQPRVRS